MRLRRRLLLGLYLLCALAVVGGLGWITWRTVRLEAQSRTETVVRLALWRMDSALTPIIAQEAARPYFHYLSFYPFERAYTELWQEVRPGEVVAPSPLLTEQSQFIKLHFQIEPDGRLTSPQAPAGNMRDQAEAEYVSPDNIIDAERRLVEMALLLGPPQQAAAADERARERLSSGRQPDAGSAASAGAALEPAPGEVAQRRMQSLLEADVEPSAPAVQRADALDFGARQEQAELARGGAQQFSKQSSRSEVAAVLPEALASAGDQFEAQVTSETGRVEQGPLRARWLADGQLALLRTVRLRDGEITQGVWLDWPALRTWLQDQVSDLLPEAQLAPAPARATGDERMLATIPAALVPGPATGSPGLGPTPARLALIITWIAVLAAVVAGGLVLRASMRLAERRGRFVSAVTHELRTPLTTFRLYSDMLAEGAIPDESRRLEYLRTLQAESQRLGTIVENVLEYARLGSARRQRRTPGAHPPEALGPALAAIEPDLRARAGRCELELQVEGDVTGVQVAAPAGAIERIMANLVDNACKYAIDCHDRRLILRAGTHGEFAEIALRDFGPGVPPAEEHRIFDAWTRARRDADGSASGLGLGLSISRALARQLGGDLELRQPEGPGAEFVLRLPLV